MKEAPNRGGLKFLWDMVVFLAGDFPQMLKTVRRSARKSKKLQEKSRQVDEFHGNPILLKKIPGEQ